MKRILLLGAALSLLISAGTSATADVRTTIEKAPTLLKAGKIEEAVESLTSVESLNGLSIREKRALADVFQEIHQELLKREEYDWLIKADSHARVLYPKERRAGVNLGQSHLAQGKFEEAHKALAAARDQENYYYPKPRVPGVQVNLLLARTSLVLGEIETATDAIKKAIEAAPSDARLYYTKAQVMMRAGKWDEVNTALATAFRLNAKLAQPVDYLVRASCYQREEAYEQAQKVLEEGLQRYPTASGLHCGLGQTFQAQGELARAFYQYQYEIMLSGPASSYTSEARDQIEIMTALLDEEKNKENFLKIAYGAAALMKMKPGGYEEALENIRKGLRANGDDCLPLQMLRGHAYMGLEKYEKATEAYRAALLIDPLFVPAYADRGDAFEAMGDREKALENYAAALTLDKHNWRVQEMLRKIDTLKKQPD